MSSTEPIEVTPELVGRLLVRALAVIDFVVADELRLREYVSAEFIGYVESATANGIQVAATGAEFAEIATAELAFARSTIAAILRDGTVAARPPETGQYL
jgi:hypothetical protein